MVNIDKIRKSVTNYDKRSKDLSNVISGFSPYYRKKFVAGSLIKTGTSTTRSNLAVKILRSQGFSLNEILEGKNIARAAKKSEGMRRIYDQDYRKKIGLI